LDSKNRRYKPGTIPVPAPKPLLIVLSGPSGVGKDAVLATIKRLKRPYHYIVSDTTRPRRSGEKDGVDYHFLSPEEFQQMIDGGRLLEWAIVYGNYYGVPRDEIARGLSRGLDVMVKVDIQGAATIRRILPQAVFIFIMPPSMEEQESRLRQRHSEFGDDLDLRLEKAREEIESLPLFDYVVISQNNELEAVVSQIDAIVAAEKSRVKPRVVEL